MSTKTRKRSRRSTFESFSEKYSFHIPEYRKNLHLFENLQLFLKARYNFFSRRPRELHIEVRNPDATKKWLVNTSIIEVLMPDSPFIVDTIVDICNSRHYKINLIIHPILSVTRDEGGALMSVDFPGAAGQNESYVYVEIHRLPKADLVQLKRSITQNLQELRKVVTDYPQMLALMEKIPIKDGLEEPDIAWLKENFVLLGLSHYQSGQLVPKHFGVFKKANVRHLATAELNSNNIAKSKGGITYRETSLRSNVNKARQMYFALIKNGNSHVILAGHFRYRAELALRNDIPAIRRLLEEMAGKFKVTSTSYLRKELFKIAQSLPVGLWLTRSPDFLFRWFMKILHNMYVTETTYELSVDEHHNLVWAEIIVPATEAGRIPNRRLDDFYENNDIEISYNVRYPINQIEVVLLGFRSKKFSLAELTTLLDANASDLFSTWASRFREAFFAKHPQKKESKERLDRYLAGMSPEYELHEEPAEALHDLDVLDALQDQDQYLVNYYQSNQVDLIKIYCCTPQTISDLVPIIKNFGFVVLRDHVFPYSHNGLKKFAYAFSVPAETALTAADRVRISDCIAAVLNGRLTSKPINEAVKVAGLSKRELDLAKALCAYFFKFNTSHAFSSIQKVLVRYPAFTKSLVGFFKTRFDPVSQPNEIKRAKKAVLHSFGELASVVDEAICKAFFNIVTAVVRTNYYLDRPEISLKIDSGLVENMPLPIPLYEIYIYSHNMEGIHLRGGRIARGGIRWSDRPDDFRTEVLGLMKAQMTKNTVIVPVGSKGGFVVKNFEPGSRDDFLKAGIETYKRFISSLLDLTDNLARNGSVVPAAGIKRYDGDDTYLVVAADKGTASFSDLANEISISRKFWLTDAFASGGSNGYDHKKQGITAKGAWESVKRLFHEIGVHPAKDQITVVGIGDMAGDVFGNGMLLSRTIKLLAAFNHLYIFLDPDPDPETSFEERKRLFKSAGNWDKYNQELISQGGGLYDRKSRSIEISPEIRDRFGIKARRLSGEDLIKAILCAPVDLIWNGGIGTYVKASTETHFQTGDPANDRLRVNGADIRARVVGEGGNLGFTQAARVEAAERGVRLNTDSIDNSAGVNMSDHEVNLKILLDILRRQRVIPNMAERNVIIKKYEKDEIKLVLRQNYLNNLGLSLDARRLPSQFVYFRALIKFLNQQGLFDKAKDCIPFETDLDRIEQGDRKLSRPVLCALAGFSKLFGTQAFLESGRFTDPWYDRFVLRYFPTGLARKYSEYINKHPLKHEIVVTEVINEVVNHAGLAFCQRMLMVTGESVTEIADVYMRLCEFLRLDELRSSIEVGEWLQPNIHYEYLIFLEEKVYQIAKKVLLQKNSIRLLDEKDSSRFSKMLKEAAIHSRHVLPRKLRITLRMFSDDDAQKIANAFKQVDILEDTFNIFINNKTRQRKWQVVEYFSIFQQYRIKELRQILKDLQATSNWEIRFFSKVETAIETLISRLVTLKSSKPGEDVSKKRQKVKNMVRDIIDLHARNALSVAAFYEMLEYVNEGVLR